MRIQKLFATAAICAACSVPTVETAHGRHTGNVNACWLDGHAKSLHVTSMTFPDPYNQGLPPEYQADNHIGWLLKFPLDVSNAYDVNSRLNDYYYDLQKGPGL